MAMTARHLAIAVMAVAAGGLAAPAAQAEGKSAGDFMVRGRVIGVLPDVSGNVSAIGGSPDASNEVVPEADLTYFITENLALELIAATNRHSVSVKGSALGDV